jgi:hypothetical protein
VAISGAVLHGQDPELDQRLNVIFDSGSAALALVGNVTDRRPACAVIAGVVGQFQKD